MFLTFVSKILFEFKLCSENYCIKMFKVCEHCSVAPVNEIMHFLNFIDEE